MLLRILILLAYWIRLFPRGCLIQHFHLCFHHYFEQNHQKYYLLGLGFLTDFLMPYFILQDHLTLFLLAYFIPDFPQAYSILNFLQAYFIQDFLQAYFIQDFLTNSFRHQHFIKNLFKLQDFIRNSFRLQDFIKNSFKLQDFIRNSFKLQGSLLQVYLHRTHFQVDFKRYFQLKGYLSIHRLLDYHQYLLFQASILRASLLPFQQHLYSIRH